MPFPTDPLLARLTLQSLSYPVTTVARADLLALIERVGLKGSALWDQVEGHRGEYMLVPTVAVRELLATLLTSPHA